MVSYPLEYKGNSALIQPLTNAPGVGGGTWNYGSRIDIRLGKVCYSEYHHPTLMHSASVEMDGMTNSVTEGPNRTAKASVRLPFSELEEGKYCNAFWSTSDW
ncbi:lactococcin 972 family bacteriocin [Corynebacterium efficiens]|uniref:lactococcin 972 family bacteriocin n=1 Tax=Corynebacterium efficiens TaxID=152794 RepID=UPI0038B2419A